MTLRKLLAAALLLALVACSTLKIAADYDHTADLARYRTFSFKDVQPTVNPLTTRRVANAIESVLTTKGLRRDDVHPDLWVVGHVHLSRQARLVTFDTAWGYGWRWHFGPAVATSSTAEIPVGTLIVDLVDAGANDLVWRGTATKVLNPKAPPEVKDRHLGEAVSKMFASYPSHS